MTNNAENISLNNHDRLAIFGVVKFEHEGESKARWTTIGTAFQNKDGSFNLRFEYMPVTGATVQIRPFLSRNNAS